jgi:hypothetical protein
MWGGALGIKVTLPPFMTTVRAEVDPRALEKLQFPPSRTIDSLLRLQSIHSCFRYTPLVLAKIDSVTKLDWS